MDRLNGVLAALSAAIEAPNSLTQMIVELERALDRAFEPAGFRICLGPAVPGAHAIPLVLEGETIGTLCLEPPAGKRRAPPENVELLRLLTAPLAAALGCRQRREERVELGRFARIDGLCRIPNRLAFEERFGAAWARCRERKTNLALALIDIDFFKAFNDRYGHVAGDHCLRRVAALLAEPLPVVSETFAARYGGEEFVVLFEGLDAPGAFAVARVWLDGLSALGLEHAGTTLGAVSASIGIAAVVPADERRPVDLIEEADRALYRAKNSGRNCVCAGDLASQGPVVARCVAARDTPQATGDPPTFGREADLARILAALRHARLLTLVGPAGIGKSRLLKLLAREASTQFERIVRVDSPRLSAGAGPAAAVASVLDLEIGPSGILDCVTAALAERPALVLLDGIAEPDEGVRAFCEHLLRYTSDVSIALVAAAPLRVAGERAIVVPPLDDEAALALFKTHGGDDSARMRRALRHLGGNPAAIEEAGRSVARFGAEVALALLAARPGADAVPDGDAVE